MLFSEEEDVFMNERDGSVRQWLCQRRAEKWPFAFKKGLPICYQWSIGWVSLTWMRGKSESMHLIVKHPLWQQIQRQQTTAAFNI